jgi:hypothetical protein
MWAVHSRTIFGFGAILVGALGTMTGCGMAPDDAAWTADRAGEVSSATVMVSADHSQLWLSLHDDESVIAFDPEGVCGAECVFNDGWGDRIRIRIAAGAGEASYVVHPQVRRNPRLAKLADSVSLVTHDVEVVDSFM